MREVAAMGEVHGEEAVAWLERGKIYGHVGLAAAVRLNIDVLCGEEFLGPFDGERFDHVHVFATAVPTPARIALGVLVGEAGTLRLHDRLAGEVLTGNELDILELASSFLANRVGDLWIDGFEG